MTYTVTPYCENCKYTDCVEVCPVEAFHEGPTMLYINPETCIFPPRSLTPPSSLNSPRRKSTTRSPAS